MTENDPRIVVTNVVKTFERGPETIRALDDVSLSVGGGEVVAMSGNSGSGKSTLLEILLGWQASDSGTVELRAEGRPGDIGVVPQNLALFDELTTAENTGLAAELANDGDLNDPHHLIELLELDDLGDRMISELSLGQQQRVAIARALASNPSIVIADEPTSHQDAERAATVMQALRAAANNRAAVLLTSHDPRLIEECDREIRIAHGRIVGEASSHRSEESGRPATATAPHPTPAKTIRFVVAVLLTVTF